MNLRSIIVAFALLILVFADGNISFANENNNNQMVLPDGSTSDSSTGNSMSYPENLSASDSNPIAVRSALNFYEAVVTGDLSLCGGDADCVEEVTMVQSWSCAAEICDATDNTKNPLDCFDEDEPDHSPFRGDQKEITLSLCAFIKSSSPVARTEFLHYVSHPNATEDAMVQVKAYLMALKGSGEECINHVKNYIGSYGPNWKYRWYRVLAGCRILSHEKSRSEQERNFLYWYNNKCPMLTDFELREACEAAKGVLSFDD